MRFHPTHFSEPALCSFCAQLHLTPAWMDFPRFSGHCWLTEPPGLLTGFVDSGLQRFPRLDIRPDACSCAFFTEEKALALGLGGHAGSRPAEFRW